MVVNSASEAVIARAAAILQAERLKRIRQVGAGGLHWCPRPIGRRRSARHLNPCKLDEPDPLAVLAPLREWMELEAPLRAGPAGR